MARLRRQRNWHGAFLLMLSFSPKATHLPMLFCHSKYVLLTISFVYNMSHKSFWSIVKPRIIKQVRIIWPIYLNWFQVFEYVAKKRQNCQYFLLSPSDYWYKKTDSHRVIKQNNTNNKLQETSNKKLLFFFCAHFRSGPSKAVKTKSNATKDVISNYLNQEYLRALT